MPFRKTGRFLITFCSIDDCGYACQLHHAAYCLLVAYGTQRTLVLRSNRWRYYSANWEDVFLPISETCVDANGSSVAHWPGDPAIQVVELPSIVTLKPRPPYLPPAIPRDIAPRLALLHGNPAVWWTGQFLKYLLRPQEETAHMLQKAGDQLGFVKPIVGVHVRQTDNISTEGSFYPLEEYMGHVEEYFLTLEVSKKKEVERRVFIASDDPKVITDVQNRYPKYVVLGNPFTTSSGTAATNNSDSSLNGIIIDIHFLSLCDYLVCTFSSQVCRVAYEIMQTLHPDAADHFRSLDDQYYFAGQNQQRQEAVLPHKLCPGVIGELELQPGDTVDVVSYQWDGWNTGQSVRTGQRGLYPSFKVQDKLDIVDFPTYPEVPLRRERALL